MSYSYERTAAGKPGPFFSPSNMIMGRAKKVYSAYFTQKTGLTWDAGSSYFYISHMVHRWYAQIPGKKGLTIELEVDSDHRNDGKHTFRFTLDDGRGDKHWYDMMSGMDAEDLKNPAFIVPAALLKDATYAGSSSTSKEAESLVRLLQNSSQSARQKAAEMVTRADALDKWTAGSLEEALRRIQANPSGMIRDLGQLDRSTSEAERLLKIVFGQLLRQIQAVSPVRAVGHGHHFVRLCIMLRLLRPQALFKFGT